MYNKSSSYRSGQQSVPHKSECAVAWMIRVNVLHDFYIKEGARSIENRLSKISENFHFIFAQAVCHTDCQLSPHATRAFNLCLCNMLVKRMLFYSNEYSPQHSVVAEDDWQSSQHPYRTVLSVLNIRTVRTVPETVYCTVRLVEILSTVYTVNTKPYK